MYRAVFLVALQPVLYELLDSPSYFDTFKILGVILDNLKALNIEGNLGAFSNWFTRSMRWVLRLRIITATESPRSKFNRLTGGLIFPSNRS